MRPARRDALHRLLGQARTYGLALSPEGFDWSKIRVPVMILWGASDRLIPMPAAHRLPPRSTLHVLDGIRPWRRIPGEDADRLPRTGQACRGADPVPRAMMRATISSEVVFSPGRFGLPSPW